MGDLHTILLVGAAGLTVLRSVIDAGRSIATLLADRRRRDDLMPVYALRPVGARAIVPSPD